MQSCLKKQMFSFSLNSLPVWLTFLTVDTLTPSSPIMQAVEMTGARHNTEQVLRDLCSWGSGYLVHPELWGEHRSNYDKWDQPSDSFNARNPLNKAGCSLTSLAWCSFESGLCVRGGHAAVQNGCLSLCVMNEGWYRRCGRAKGKHNLWWDDRKPSWRGKLNLSLAGRETGPQLRGQQAQLTELLNRQMREASVN